MYIIASVSKSLFSFWEKVSFLLMFTPRSFRARSIDRIAE